MRVEDFKELPAAAITIRTEVFMKEQGFQDEFDEVDTVARHMLLYAEDRAIATCRVYYSKEHQSYMIGRIAVLKPYRGKQIGAKLVGLAEKLIAKEGGSSAMLMAQKRAEEFYGKMGYVPTGLQEVQEGCPHIMMRKEL